MGGQLTSLMLLWLLWAAVVEHQIDAAMVGQVLKTYTKGLKFSQNDKRMTAHQVNAAKDASASVCLEHEEAADRKYDDGMDVGGGECCFQSSSHSI